MSEIFTEIEIAASANDVWRVLTNFDAYPEWNSLMRPEGREIRPGAQLKILVRMKGWIHFSFRPILRNVETGRELAWKGRLPARLLQAVHSFTIEPRGKDRVRLIHREVFEGWLVPIYMWLMGAWATRAYVKMNEELKARAEGVSAPASSTRPSVAADPPALTSI